MKNQNSVSPADTSPISRRPAQTSLRNAALRRATQAYVPRTLTPHEWEQYYEEHGVPASHRDADD